MFKDVKLKDFTKFYTKFYLIVTYFNGTPHNKLIIILHNSIGIIYSKTYWSIFIKLSTLKTISNKSCLNPNYQTKILNKQKRVSMKNYNKKAKTNHFLVKNAGKPQLISSMKFYNNGAQILYKEKTNPIKIWYKMMNY